MVMEAPPTPQCVGREFVRQYYTLLNKAPAHLHRFYNNNSSFVHGGLDPPNRETKPMVGQRQIHQMIQRLNFRDCHAKISQVDSQATLGDGVVVQVTGELSNGGQPMRRFTQTFVLAAQSPKKYYVHNDIFRYQDMLVSDEDLDHDSGRSDGEEDVESGVDISQPMQQPPSQNPQYYQPSHPQQLIGGAQPQIMQPTVNGMVHVEEMSSLPPVAPQPITQAPVPTPVQPSSVTATQQPVPSAPLVQPIPQAPVEEPNVMPEESTEDIDESADAHGNEQEEEAASLGATQDEKDESTLNESFEDQPSEAVHNEPKTYATLLKGFSQTAGYSAISSKTSPTSPPPAQRTEHSSMASGPPAAHRPGNVRPTRGATNVRGIGRPSMDRQGGRPPFSDDSDGERRRSGPSNTAPYPDHNQLFLGNLPHHVTEEELKKLFAMYGNVADLRIHSKNNNLKGNGPPGNKVPNYGFITFEDASSVKAVLEKRPIMFDSQKLNVEEKKPRNRNDTGNGPDGRDRDGRPGPRGDGSMVGRGGVGPSNMGNPRMGQPGSAPRGGSGMRGGRGGGNFNREREGGPGGQGGPGRGGNMNGSNRGGYAPRRQ
ncbi:ras GTPase-activating protein-binding protein 2 [Thrips palmi]|uniref:Ras GTPase-activating protein-binding protein 2 n=1 Tax=Thrips palmi TaxID=161013 RepID=A0A6P8XZV3_THRPL|nr:ras GTPase-activating protein-binding protein 2 [Thrips palmi]XP_034232708.1 ras GTPase-activating protein-binding protein 2 [Thrips palmi]